MLKRVEQKETRLNIRITKELKEAIQVRADEIGINTTSYVTMLLTKAVNSKDK